MPLSVSALSHSEVSGNHTTRCPTTVGRPADGKKTDRPEAARNVCVEPESSIRIFRNGPDGLRVWA